MHVPTQGFRFGIPFDPNPHLAGVAPNNADNRRWSLAYVPRPRRLLARRQGGSFGSRCGLPFFRYILEHLITSGFRVRQCPAQLQLLRLRLQLVVQGQHRLIANAQFSRQRYGCLALQNAAQQQDYLGRRQVVLLQHGSSIQVICPSAWTAVYSQAALARLTENPSAFLACTTARTPQLQWAEMVLHPLAILLVAYQVQNWEFHVA